MTLQSEVRTDDQAGIPIRTRTSAGQAPHTEVEQALAFYDEAISDRMEDGLSEAEAVDRKSVV